jgi:hypothetical protein
MRVGIGSGSSSPSASQQQLNNMAVTAEVDGGEQGTSGGGQQTGSGGTDAGWTAINESALITFNGTFSK